MSGDARGGDLEPGTAMSPAWVTPPHRKIIEVHYWVHRLAELLGTAEPRGQLAAIEWVTQVRRTAPVTERETPVTRDLVRAEGWVAACVAAELPPPLRQDWKYFGEVDPRPAVVTDSDFAYGVWTTLVWLVGVRPEPPVEPPERDADGRLTAPQRYALRPDPSSPLWQSVDGKRRQRQLADAQAYWHRVRKYLHDRERRAEEAREQACWERLDASMKARSR